MTDNSHSEWCRFKEWSRKIKWTPVLVIMVAYNFILAIVTGDVFIMGVAVFAIGVLLFSRYVDVKVAYTNQQLVFLVAAIKMMKDAVEFRVIRDEETYQICKIHGEEGSKLCGIQCKVCGTISFHPTDIEKKYCSNCKKFHQETIH